MRLDGDVDGVHVALELRLDPDAATGRIFASGASLQRIEGFALRGRVAGTAKSALAHGYGSWSPTTFARVEPAADGTTATTPVGNNDDYTITDPRVSWWLGALTVDDAALVTGAQTAGVWKSRVVTEHVDDATTSWSLLVGNTGESLPLGTVDAPSSSEELVLLIAPDASSGLDAYGARIAARTPPPAAPFAPVMWSSWNTLFEAVASTDVDDALAFVATDPLPLPINTIQIDDGWADRWGDWVASPTRFPAGMKAEATKIAAAGLVPGLWWAPFLVDTESETAAAHPDWLLRISGGDPIAYTVAPGRPTYFVLDVQVPEARAHLLALLDSILDDGFRYLKLDFLFAGAFEVQRGDVTALQAWGGFIDEVSARARAQGAYLLSCGAPVLPSAGRFHALRTGDDIAFDGFEYSFAFNKNAFRNVSNRFFVRHFLANDPDTVLLRGLTPEVQQVNATAALLTNGIVGFGDVLPTLDANARATLERAASLGWLPPRGQGFRVIDVDAQPNRGALSKIAVLLAPDDSTAPERWVLALDDGTHLVALFNWFATPQTVSVDLAAIVGHDVETAHDVWRDVDVTLDAGQATFDQPGASVTLLAVPAR
jgi:alpha-galactosidase